MQPSSTLSASSMVISVGRSAPSAVLTTLRYFREEYEENGEALRDDEHFSYVAAWEWTGNPGEPRLHEEPLTFEYVKPTKRSYK